MLDKLGYKMTEDGSADEFFGENTDYYKFPEDDYIQMWEKEDGDETVIIYKGTDVVLIEIRKIIGEVEETEFITMPDGQSIKVEPRLAQLNTVYNGRIDEEWELEFILQRVI